MKKIKRYENVSESKTLNLNTKQYHYMNFVLFYLVKYKFKAQKLAWEVFTV